MNMIACNGLLVWAVFAALGVVPTGSGGNRQESDAAGITSGQSGEISILFVGNSHTQFHDLPHVVREMIRFSEPDRDVTVDSLIVGFLDEAMRAKALKKLSSRRWTFVVLQGQKISMSGRYDYSKKEGIEIARRAGAQGAKVIFYSEWGRQGVDGDAARIKNIYERMANQSGATVAAVGDAWDVASDRHPDFPLYASDGNHQAELGAFLTGCVLYGVITGRSPSELADFPSDVGSAEQRKALVDCAAATFESSTESD